MSGKHIIIDNCVGSNICQLYTSDGTHHSGFRAGCKTLKASRRARGPDFDIHRRVSTNVLILWRLSVSGQLRIGCKSRFLSARPYVVRHPKPQEPQATLPESVDSFFLPGFAYPYPIQPLRSNDARC
eukprot:992842-Amorphochlora_amoeboformis.AAC.1